jgi:hypothetical protein
MATGERAESLEPYDSFSVLGPSLIKQRVIGHKIMHPAD